MIPQLLHKFYFQTVKDLKNNNLDHLVGKLGDCDYMRQELEAYVQQCNETPPEIKWIFDQYNQTQTV